MFQPDDEQGSMRLNEALSNPWIAYPYIALSGLASAASPALARGAYGVNTALRTGMEFEKTSQERKKSKRLNEALLDYATPKPSTVFAPDTSPGQPSMTPERLDAVMSRIPTVGGMPEGPDRDFIQMMAKSGQGEKALPFLSQKLNKEPAAPQVFGSGESGYYGLDRSGRLTRLVPGQPKQTSPWRPYQTDLGDKIETGVFNQATGERRAERVEPKGAAPHSAKSPEEIARIKSQIELDRARVLEIRNSIAIANNAKTATVGQLAQALNALNLARVYGSDSNDDENQLIADAKMAVLQELALRKRKYTASAQPQPTLSASGGAEGGQIFETLPPASRYKGRTLRKDDGSMTLVSDGVNWRDEKGQIVPDSLTPQSEY